MSLFAKKTVEHSLNFSLGTKKLILIVGLGNIGKEYAGTRHNIGFECLDIFRENQSEFDAWKDKKELFCQLATGTFNGDTKVILAKPSTFMNNSGKAVQAITSFFKLQNDSVTIVHDELDIPFGQIRTRTGGGSAGHNGIKSISSSIGDDYNRIRIGILNDKPEQMESADYVLAKFTKNEQEELPLLKREVQSILIELIYSSKLLAETRTYI